MKYVFTVELEDGVIEPKFSYHRETDIHKLSEDLTPEAVTALRNLLNIVVGINGDSSGDFKEVRITSIEPIDVVSMVEAEEACTIDSMITLNHELAHELAGYSLVGEGVGINDFAKISKEVFATIEKYGKVIIVFPLVVESVSFSYIEGYFKELRTRLGHDGFMNAVKVKCHPNVFKRLPIAFGEPMESPKVIEESPKVEEVDIADRKYLIETTTSPVKYIDPILSTNQSHFVANINYPNSYSIRGTLNHVSAMIDESRKDIWGNQKGMLEVFPQITELSLNESVTFDHLPNIRKITRIE